MEYILKRKRKRKRRRGERRRREREEKGGGGGGSREEERGGERGGGDERKEKRKMKGRGTVPYYSNAMIKCVDFRSNRQYHNTKEQQTQVHTLSHAMDHLCSNAKRMRHM